MRRAYCCYYPRIYRVVTDIMRVYFRHPITDNKQYIYTVIAFM